MKHLRSLNIVNLQPEKLYLFKPKFTFHTGEFSKFCPVCFDNINKSYVIKAMYFTGEIYHTTDCKFLIKVIS